MDVALDGIFYCWLSNKFICSSEDDTVRLVTSRL